MHRPILIMWLDGFTKKHSSEWNLFSQNKRDLIKSYLMYIILQTHPEFQRYNSIPRSVFVNVISICWMLSKGTFKLSIGSFNRVEYTFLTIKRTATTSWQPIYFLNQISPPLCSVTWGRDSVESWFISPSAKIARSSWHTSPDWMSLWREKQTDLGRDFLLAR